MNDIKVGTKVRTLESVNNTRWRLVDRKECEWNSIGEVIKIKIGEVHPGIYLHVYCVEHRSSNRAWYEHDEISKLNKTKYEIISHG